MRLNETLISACSVPTMNVAALPVAHPAAVSGSGVPASTRMSRCCKEGHVASVNLAAPTAAEAPVAVTQRPCRETLRLGLHLLLAVCQSADLASSKKLRQQVVDDVCYAAERVQSVQFAAGCDALRSLCSTLKRSLPLKGLRRIDQIVTKAIISTKRLNGTADKAAATPGPASSLVHLPDEAISHILVMLEPPQLAALSCTCRCAAASHMPHCIVGVAVATWCVFACCFQSLPLD
jgi:hypothetical protein